MSVKAGEVRVVISASCFQNKSIQKGVENIQSYNTKNGTLQYYMRCPLNFPQF